MYFKTEDLNYDERKFIGKISDIVRWAKQNNRNDVLNEIENAGTIQNLSTLRNTYYKLNSMKRSENGGISNNKSALKMEENQAQQPTQNETAPAASTPPPSSSVDPTSFDPLLGGTPKQRDYTSGLPNNNAAAPQGSIPEPNFQAKAGGSFGQLPPNEPDNRFKEQQDLPPNQKAQASRDLAKFLVSAYADNIPTLFSMLVKVPEDKLTRMYNTGEIDPNLVINAPPLQVTVAEYFKIFNSQADDAFVVTDEWKMEILPHVEKVMMENNWGITSKQVIMFMLGQNMIQNGLSAMKLRSDLKNMMEFLKETTAEMRRNGIISPPPPPPTMTDTSSDNPPSAPSGPPPAPPIPPSEPIIETVEAEIVPNEDFRGIEVVENIEKRNYDTPTRFVKDGRNKPPAEEAEDMPTATHITSGK